MALAGLMGLVMESVGPLATFVLMGTQDVRLVE